MYSKEIKTEKSESKLVHSIIVALARDYERRKRALIGKTVSRRVQMEYSYINSRMLSAAAEVVGIAIAETFIYEIGNLIGYASSEIDYMSESTYKVMKHRITRGIAKKLNFID